MQAQNRAPALGPVLLILCAYLAIWQPVNLAAAAVRWVSALAVRGWPLGALLSLRVVVVAIGVAAARSIVSRRPGALPLSLSALLLTMTTDLVVFATAIAPNNRVPGDTPWYVAGTIVFHAAWLWYLWRSAHVHRMLS